jgi:hypothetical protein
MQPMNQPLDSRHRNFARFLPHMAALLAMALWWGGLTFYAAFVVPTGVEVLGGATEQGFVTQRVSKIINLLGALTLAMLIWNAFANWRAMGRTTKAVLITSWIVMAGTQLVLFVIHPRLDAMLDVQTHSIIDPTAFHPLHEFYLTIVSVQWFAGLAHLVAVTTSI